MAQLGTRLGTCLGTQLGTSLSPAGGFALLVALTAGRPLFNADFYVVDGVSGKVRSVVDWLDPTHIIDQSVSANQLALPLPHADFGGRACFTNTAVIGGFYQSNRAVAAWNYTSDGTGVEIYDARTYTSTAVNQIIYRTSNGLNPGVINVITGANISNEVRGAAGASRLTLNPAAVVSGSPLVHRLSHATADAPNGRAQKTGAVEVSGPYTGALTTPTATLGVFGLGALSLSFVGRMRWLGFFPLLTPTQRDAIMAMGLAV